MSTLPPLHATVRKDGYTLTFYPGFLRRGTALVAGGVPEVLYEQTVPYDVRDRPDEPLTRYVLAVEGGPNERSLSLTVDDPEHAVAEIVVRLHPPGFVPGEGTPVTVAEELGFQDNTVLCPPVC